MGHLQSSANSAISVDLTRNPMLSIRPYTASTAAARPSNRFSAWPLSCVREARKDIGGSHQQKTMQPESGLGLRPE
jgi:hypothetical protein